MKRFSEGSQLRDFLSREIGVSGAALFGLTSLAVALRIWDPSSTGLYPPCPFHAWTGLDCPGCGSLRALRAMAMGDLAAALRWNPLATVFAPIGGVLLAHDVVARRNRTGPNRIRPIEISSRWAWSILAILILFGVARNLA